MMRLVRTPDVIQMEPLECGSVALGIVLAYYGRWVALEELRVACGISRNGSTAANILRAARNFGLAARAVKVEPEGLAKLTPPVILHWNFGHFVVFEGFYKNGRGRVNDPGMGRRHVSMIELDESMTGVVLTFEPGRSFERGGERPRLWRALRQRIDRTQTAIWFVLLVSLLLVIPGLSLPAFSRLFVDYVLQWRETSWMMPLLAAMTATLIVLSGLTWLQRSFLLRFETRVAVEGASRLFWHLLRLPMDFFNQRYPGEISSRISLNDRVANLLSGELSVSALSFFMLVLCAAVMIQYDAVLTAISVAVVASNLLIFWWVYRRRADANRRLIREETRLEGTALWGLEIIESLKATSSEGDLFARWAGQQAKLIKVRQELEVASQPLEAWPALLTAVNAALILAIGGSRVIDGHISLGGLVAFQILTATFTGPVNRLVTLAQRLQLAEGEIGLLDDMLRVPPALDTCPARAISAKKLSGRLELRNVTFGYSPMDPPVLKRVDLDVSPGACVAVTGKTGSGKSTLGKLVCGLFEPWQGRILFDGRPRSETPRDLWLNSVAAVDQDIMFFEGTVRENLTLSNEGVSESRLLAAIHDACIAEEIFARPGGLDGWIAEGGVNWSGGQLQRLEIARALARDPALLILDEATSALDPPIEARIVRNLRRRGCACLVIAHRLSIIREADEIIVLEDGAVAERGRHDDLIASSRLYASLVINE